MGQAILTTLFGANLTLLDCSDKLAAPRFASASGTSRETLVPMMDMLPTRGDWHKPHLISHSTSGLLSGMCNCDQRRSGFGVRKRIAAALRARWAKERRYGRRGRRNRILRNERNLLRRCSGASCFTSIVQCPIRFRKLTLKVQPREKIAYMQPGSRSSYS